VTETKFLEVSYFMLQKGGFLPFVRLAYRTIGGLNAAKDTPS
jgi:homoserine acetyltransferase